MNALAYKRDREEPWSCDNFSRDIGKGLFQPRLVESEESATEPAVEYIRQVCKKYGFDTSNSKVRHWPDLWNEVQKKWVLFNSGYTITVEEQACGVLREFNYDSGWMSYYGSLTKPTPACQPIDHKLRYSITNILQKASQKSSDLEKDFDRLAATWYQETRMLSFARQKALHPSYQRIIGMGRDALPFIFRELEKGKGDWMWAIECITRLPENPAPKGARYKEAVRIWLQWARTNGYI